VLKAILLPIGIYVKLT